MDVILYDKNQSHSPDLKVDVDGAAVAAADLPGALLVGIVVAGVVGGGHHACPRVERISLT